VVAAGGLETCADVLVGTAGAVCWVYGISFFLLNAWHSHAAVVGDEWSRLCTSGPCVRCARSLQAACALHTRRRRTPSVRASRPPPTTRSVARHSVCGGLRAPGHGRGGHARLTQRCRDRQARPATGDTCLVFGGCARAHPFSDLTLICKRPERLMVALTPSLYGVSNEGAVLGGRHGGSGARAPGVGTSGARHPQAATS